MTDKRKDSQLASRYAEVYAVLGAAALICNLAFGHPALPMLSLFGAALLLVVAATANQLRVTFGKRTTTR